MAGKYESIEHTADVRIRMQAETLADLFANAAFGMFDLMVGAEKVRPEISREITVDANDYEELLVDWLSELLFLFETERLAFSEFEIQEIDEKHLAAVARGEEYSPDRHEQHMDIKAVTYYGLKVEQQNSHWQATVVFDI